MKRPRTELRESAQASHSRGIGSLLLAATVIGSGVMASAGRGNAAIALLVNTGATLRFSQR